MVGFEPSSSENIFRPNYCQNFILLNSTEKNGTFKNQKATNTEKSRNKCINLKIYLSISRFLFPHATLKNRDLCSWKKQKVSWDRRKERKCKQSQTNPAQWKIYDFRKTSSSIGKRETLKIQWLTYSRNQWKEMHSKTPSFLFSLDFLCFCFGQKSIFSLTK